MTKITAEQVLAHFESLDEQQKQATLQLMLGKTSKVFDKDQGGFKMLTTADAIISMALPFDEEYVFYSVAQKQQTLPAKEIPLPVYISPGKYLTQYNQFWLLESLLGSDIVKKALKRRRIVDDRLIERLFSKDKHLYYLNQNRNYLFATSNELLEFDFGILTPITALEALQQFGLEKMEEAKEKLYVRL